MKLILVILFLIFALPCYGADVAQNSVTDGSATVATSHYLNGYSGTTSYRYTIESILGLKTTVSGTSGGLAGTPNIVVGTISAGATGFSVDADGDVIGKSFLTSRVAGVTSAVDLYEVPANGDSKVTIKPPDALAGDAVITTPGVTSTLATLESPSFTTPTLGAALATSVAFGADPADSGALRLSNNTAVAWEQSTPGTDIYIALDSSDILHVGQNAAQINIGTSGTGNVAITGNLTVTGSDINVGAAGVKLTGDGDGAITFLGLGDGYDEDLTINLDDTENTAVVSSSTGVTKISTGAIGIATTGTLQGGVAVASDADGMDGTAMTAAGMYGTTFIATGAGTWTLPTAVAGMSVCLMDSGTAHDLILDVQVDDDIQLKGTEQANGVGITNASGSTTGDLICVIAISAGHWATVGGGSGTWASQ